MSLKKIIYLQSEQDFETLVNTGSLTKDGRTLTYEPDTTDYRVKYEPEAVPVKGIKINSVDQTPDSEGKVNIPVADATNVGVVKAHASNGIKVITGGMLSGAARTLVEYEASSNDLAIAKGTLENVITGKSQSFSCEMADGTTKTLTILGTLV